MNNSIFYRDRFYPLQDRVLRVIRSVDSGFYLTGGTAASRGYLNHRYSDDLDFFVNDDERFHLWLERMIIALSHQQQWLCQVLLKEERFARLNLVAGDMALKLEWVNDVPARVGDIVDHPALGRLDSPENILANKITALLDREEPKDLVDIWGFCCRMNLSIKEAIENADSKAAGIFPADIARLLCSATPEDWSAIRWVDAPPVEQFLSQLNALGESLLLDY